MKKIFLSAFILFALSIQAFALGNRYFELKVDVPVSVANSTIFATDIFKETIEIDLPKIADSMPKSGFSLNLFAAPTVSINLDLRFLYIGFNVGVEVQSSTTISKDIFDFLGKGNSLNQTIEVLPTFDTDVFMFVDTKVGFNVRKIRITAVPTVFFPVVHTALGKSNISIQNTSSGSFIFNLDAGLDIYSPFTSSDIEKITTGSFEIAKLFSFVGFDLAGSVQFELIRGLDFYGYLRMPIVPAIMKGKVSTGVTCSGEINLIDLVSGGAAPNFTPVLSPFVDVADDTMLSRPFKAMVGIDWTGFGRWLRAYADLGLGVRYPFTPSAQVYPEYILGLDLSLFNILGLSLSSRYVDLIYSHKLGIFINARLFEIDVGVASQATSFIGTFRLGGLGIYLTFCMGF